MSHESALPLAGSSQSISWSFWARRLHSLSGVVPVGVFLLEHFWTNSYAVFGAEKYNEAIRHLQSLPYVILLEIGIIAVPILFHAIYGLVISFQGRPNSLAYPYMRNWMYWLQRVSGVILFFYIGFHVYETRVTMALRGEIITYDYMAQLLNQGWAFWFYLIGMLAAVFHFANGLWAFGIGWGLTTTTRAMRVSAYFCIGFGIFLGLVGVNSLLAFYGKALVIHL